MNEKDALDVVAKLENWMKTTNETLKTLVLRTENQQIDIACLKKRIKMLESQKLILVN